MTIGKSGYRWMKQGNATTKDDGTMRRRVIDRLSSRAASKPDTPHGRKMAAKLRRRYLPVTAA